jgi:protein-disulfide isomerase
LLRLIEASSLHATSLRAYFLHPAGFHPSASYLARLFVRCVLERAVALPGLQARIFTRWRSSTRGLMRGLCPSSGLFPTGLMRGFLPRFLLLVMIATGSWACEAREDEGAADSSLNRQATPRASDSQAADGGSTERTGAEEGVPRQPGAPAEREEAYAEGIDTTGLSVAGGDTLSARTPEAEGLLELADSAPSIGPVDAAIVILEFSDFECPFCARARDTMHRLMQDRPEVRLIYMQYPIVELHPGAMVPAEASLEAHRQGKFWQYHDALFAHGPPLSRKTVLKIAGDEGLDVAAMRRALDQGTHRARVEREVRIGRELGITGTPTFFVNGYRIIGARPYETFVTVYNLLLRASRRSSLARSGPSD